MKFTEPLAIKWGLQHAHKAKNKTPIIGIDKGLEMMGNFVMIVSWLIRKSVNAKLGNELQRYFKNENLPYISK